MDRRGNNAMRLIKTEEEKNLEKIYAPYYDYTKTPALSPDAPEVTKRKICRIAKVTKWEQSQGKIVVKLIDNTYLNVT